MGKKEENQPKSDIFPLAFDLSLPPEFLFCGRFIADPGWIHSRRIIDSWEILMGISGPVWVEEDGREYCLGAGDVLFFRPQAEHCGTRASPPGASFYWAHFRLRGSGGRSPGQKGHESPSSLSPGSPDISLNLRSWMPGAARGKARSVMTQLQEASAGTSALPGICDYLTGLLLLELQASGHEPGQSGGDQAGWFSHLLEWVRVHPELPLSVGELARQADRHPDYLARVFREQLGMSPLEFLHRRRLEEAKRRLVETNAPLKQIAWDLGISDERQLTRLFRRHASMSPREYRQTYSRVRLNR